MIRNILCSALLCVLLVESIFSQGGLKKYKNYSYAESTSDLLRMASSEDASEDVVKKLANAYYFMGDMQDASVWYSRLIEMNPDTDFESYYRYTHALRSQGGYDKANEILSNLADKNPNDLRIKSFLNNRDYSEEFTSGNYELENMENINTPYSDFGTFVSSSGALIFSSSRSLGENIYSWNKQPYLDLFELSPDDSVSELSAINTKYHESSGVLTKDGSTLYFTRNNFNSGRVRRSDKRVNGLKIYKATLVEGKWSNVEELPFNSNNYNVAHPALNADETKLYFSSDMPGTLGSSDIYVVDINSDGTYGTPKNLGSRINTEGRENFPFVSSSGMLYFSSDGHIGLGGLDVFKISLEGDDMPKNLGAPINSQKDDFSLIVNDLSGQGYLSSNRIGGKGDDDIYRFVEGPCIRKVSGVVVNKVTKKLLPEVDLVLQDSEGVAIKTFKSDISGQFDLQLPCTSKQYNIKGTKAYYKEGSTMLKLDANKISIALDPEIDEPIISKPSETKYIEATKGEDLTKVLNLNPIYFELNKYNITPIAEIELLKVIKYMREYPNAKIDVRSHTDSRSDDSYNLRLSKDRCLSTMDYLIKVGGISRTRLTGDGYGETQLTNDCSNGVDCTETQHQANRRSEFIIIN